MTFPGRAMVQGTFTAPATLPGIVNVNCGFTPSKVELINRSKIGSNSANEDWEKVSWNTDFGSIHNYVEWHTASATTMNVSDVTSKGITLYNGSAASPNQYILGTKINGTSYDNTTGIFTVTSNTTFYAGATVLITNRGTAGGAGTMSVTSPGLCGMFFTIDSVTSTTFTLANADWLNAGYFVTGAQTFSAQLVTTPELYYPRTNQITNIEAENPMVVVTSVSSNLTVGQQVRLKVPAFYQMTQADGLTGIITAVSKNEVTIGAIDASAFTAFAWNNNTAQTTIVGLKPALLIPIGSGPSVAAGPPIVTYNVDVLDDATDSQAFKGFSVGTGLLQTSTASVIGIAASDVISWTAWSQDA